MTRLLAAAFATSLATSITLAQASVTKLYERVGNWNVVAYGDDDTGKWHNCSAGRTFEAGQTLWIIKNRDGRWSFAVKEPETGKKWTQRGTLRLYIDRRLIGSGKIGLNNRQFVAGIPSTIMKRLRSGWNLRLKGVGIDYHMSLVGSKNAMNSVAECWNEWRHKNARVADPKKSTRTVISGKSLKCPNGTLIETGGAQICVGSRDVAKENRKKLLRMAQYINDRVHVTEYVFVPEKQSKNTVFWKYMATGTIGILEVRPQPKENSLSKFGSQLLNKIGEQCKGEWAFASKPSSINRGYQFHDSSAVCRMSDGKNIEYAQRIMLQLDGSIVRLFLSSESGWPDGGTDAKRFSDSIRTYLVDAALIN